MRVVEYQRELSNVRLEELGDGQFQVTLSGRSDIAPSSTAGVASFGIVEESLVTRPADPDGIKTSFATSIAPVSLSGVSLDGILVEAGVFPAGGRVSITASAQNGAYSTSAIVVTRTDATPPQVETIAFTSANGGETISTTKRFAGEIRIDLPGMGSALGSLQIGVAEERTTTVNVYPTQVRHRDMTTAIGNAFSVLSAVYGKALEKELGRRLGPVDLFSYRTKLEWEKRVAIIAWFGVTDAA